VALLRDAILALLGRGGIMDVAFIGSASGLYGWVPSRIVDFDAFIFAGRLDRTVGCEIQSLERDVRQGCDARGVDFELRIIQGAYKPQRTDADRPIVLAHLGVFDEREYLDESPVKRWAWRKYPCERDTQRLARLAPERPTPGDLLYGPRGIVEKLADLRSGATSMIEWMLPDLHVEVRRFDCDSPVFTEFCHGAAATTARHHARLLDRIEADSMGNSEFFAWYDANVLRTRSLLPLMALKARSRDEGFGPASVSRELAIDFLEEVRKSLA
jgi:hypothetical protein